MREHLHNGTSWTILQIDRLRILLGICEDFERADAGSGAGVRSGVSHILVPVLDAPLHKHRWNATASRRWLNESGASAVVSNSLVIGRRQRLVQAGSGSSLAQIPDAMAYPPPPTVSASTHAVDVCMFEF